MINIHIPEVIDLINNEPIPPEPHEKYGWFTCDIENKIRIIIQKFLTNQIEILKHNVIL